MNTECMLIVFESTHKAIRTERLLLDQIKIDMIPTPREITASCGLTIQFEIADVAEAKALLENEEKTGMSLYRYEKDKTVKVTHISWEE